jgi:hypothetical protein
MDCEGVVVRTRHHIQSADFIAGEVHDAVCLPRWWGILCKSLTTWGSYFLVISMSLAKNDAISRVSFG